MFWRGASNRVECSTSRPISTASRRHMPRWTNGARSSRSCGWQTHEASMTRRTSDELDKIAAAEELELASVRRDGTLRKPVTMWVVRVGDDIYVRSVKGRTGP